MVRARCPNLELIVIDDMEGLAAFRDPMAVSLQEFIARGREYMKGREGLWQDMLDSRGTEDLAILVYTSGTTGPPKGAMHANKSVLAEMRHADVLFPVTAHEERLLFLPLCHVAERVGATTLRSPPARP